MRHIKQKIFSLIVVLTLLMNTLMVYAAGPPINQGTTGNKTFTASWNPITYSITYNLGGGSNSGSNPSSYTIETPTITLINPSRTGYNFTGWSPSSTITKGSTGNKSFTAGWSPKSYTVTFNANGGSTTSSSKSVTYGLTYSTLPTCTYSGYVFMGWYTDPSYGSKITETTTVTITSNQTLYAHWQAPVTTSEFNSIVTNDNRARSSSIVSFINSNIGKDRRICFQGFSDGKWYVKAATSFEGNPDLVNNGGTLIYSGYSSNEQDNFRQAVIVGNIINFMLYTIKGTEYGSYEPVFTGAGITNYWGGETHSINKGVYNVSASDTANIWWCSCHGHFAGYNGTGMGTNGGNVATWW